MKKWEYRRESECTPAELDVYGFNGWELIAVVYVDSIVVERFYFKREI